MGHERYDMLAAVIAAHPNRTVIGRTRLQKTIMLLQEKGLPTDYDYMLYFYGPYSEALHVEASMLASKNIIDEETYHTPAENIVYKITAKSSAKLNDIQDKFGNYIDKLTKHDTVVLELAATYIGFLKLGMNDSEAWRAVKKKKGARCSDKNKETAKRLLQELEII